MCVCVCVCVCHHERLRVRIHRVKDVKSGEPKNIELNVSIGHKCSDLAFLLHRWCPHVAPGL